MSKSNSKTPRTFTAGIDDERKMAHAWLRTIESKAARASHGARGQAWYFTALARCLAGNIDADCYRAEGELTDLLRYLSGRTEVQC